MGVGGGGGLRVRVYQFKLKGLAGGGGGLGFCYVIIFCKDGSAPYKPPSQLFLKFCFDHISHKNLLFFRLII